MTIKLNTKFDIPSEADLEGVQNLRRRNINQLAFSNFCLLLLSLIITFFRKFIDNIVFLLNYRTCLKKKAKKIEKERKTYKTLMGRKKR